MHRTRIRHIPADPDRHGTDDVRSHPSAGQAGGYYFQALRDDRALPATRPGDLLYTELVLHDQVVKACWWIAGEDYLQSLSEDQLLEHLGATVVTAAEALLHP